MRFLGTLVKTLWLVMITGASIVASAQTSVTLAGGDGGDQPQPRMALLIGNKTYSGAPSPGITRLGDLKNPCKDVEDIAARLIVIGWDEKDIVTICDADTSRMISELRSFIQRFQFSERPVGIVYFAGHGVQVNEKNYLFGVDAGPNMKSVASLLARNPKATLFLRDSVDINSLIYNAVGRITAGALLIVVDACRNNPLFDIVRQNHMPVTATAPKAIASPPGIVTEYSTTDGATADDGVGANSPFASAFIAHMRDKTRIDDILAEVGTQVTDDTGEKEIPQRTGYFAQQSGSIWCFAGCSAGLDIPTRFGSTSRNLYRVVDYPYAAFAPGILRLQLAADDEKPISVDRAIGSTPEPMPSQREMQTPVASADQNMGPEVIFQRELRSLPNSDAVSPLSIDVFYCLGTGSLDRKRLSHTIANRIVAIAGDAPANSSTAITQVRVRPVVPDAGVIPAPALDRDIILFDNTDAGSEYFAYEISKSSEGKLALIPERDRTSGYMSLFFCSSGVTARPPGRIYFQIASRDQESLARKSIETLQGVLPSAVVSDSVDVQPERAPDYTEVHYAFPQDGQAANTLASTLSSTLGVPVTTKLVGGEPTEAPSTFAIWFGRSLGSAGSNPRDKFWTSKDVSRDAVVIKNQLQHFRCGLPGLC